MKKLHGEIEKENRMFNQLPIRIMSTTNIIIGVGAGAIIAIALYYYFSNKRDPERDNNEQDDIQDDEIESVEKISYDMLIAWLKSEHKSVKISTGDQFFVLQNPVAKESFEKVFPKDKNLLKDSFVLCVGIMRNNEIISSKFFIYKTMAESLADILPKDPNKSFIQKIED